MGTFRGLRAALIVGPGLLIGLACTAILKPRDSVQRCGSATDCEDAGDNRYVVECKFPDGSDLDSDDVDKVCVAAFKPQSCDAMSIAQGNMDHPLMVALEEAEIRGYVCAMEELGTAGCPPIDGITCNDGLQNSSGICLPPGEDAVSIAGNADLEGQDVLDQFCRQFFCDENFVCDRETLSCVECEDGRSFGNGGCGTVYTHGGPSCVYADPEDTCDAPNSNQDEPNFGECV